MKKTIPLFLLSIILLWSLGVIAQVNLSNGLVGSYPFDGNANDLSGLGNNGTVTGASLANDRFGNPNSSYSFNGIDQFISIGNNNSLKMQNGLSISVWIKPYTIPTSGLYNIISDHAPGEAVDGSGKVLRFAGNEIQFIVYGVYAFGNAIYARYTFPTSEGNKWHHIVGTYDGSLVKLYIDGVLVDQISNNLPIAVNNNPLLIGKSGYGEYFNGEMDDLRIYNRGLTSDEVSALYNISGEVNLNEGLIAYYPFDGNLRDYSSNGNNITSALGTSFTSNKDGISSSALTFSGGFSRILAPSSPSLNNVGKGMSISLWINQTSANCSTCPDQIPNYGYIIVDKYEFG
ncbi:MAG: LamG domain-containing protein, partial [Cytophagales bacterium]|nr:LamG domain-containing protein [Cytophagales bacterium]